MSSFCVNFLVINFILNLSMVSSKGGSITQLKSGLFFIFLQLFKYLLLKKCPNFTHKIRNKKLSPKEN